MLERLSMNFAILVGNFRILKERSREFAFRNNDSSSTVCSSTVETSTQTECETQDISVATDFLEESIRTSTPVVEKRNSHNSPDPSLKVKRSKRTKSSERNLQVVLKGIPLAVSMEDIEKDLKSHQIMVKKVSRLKSWKKPSKDLRHVVLSTSATWTKLKRIRTLLGFRIRIENLVEPLPSQGRHSNGMKNHQKLQACLKTILAICRW